MENKLMSSYDIIVVGGGSAGAVMASRLSENPDRKILLLEAGKVYAPNDYPEVISKADHVTGDQWHDWQYEGDTGIASRKIRAFRGKVLGGSSSVNAGVAIRARKPDFDQWEKLGLKGWSFDKVATTYQEMNLFPVRQLNLEELTPGLRAFADATAAEGFNRITAFNGTEQDGVGPYPLNVSSGIRHNTGMTYLNDAVRKRPNLTILGDQTIDSILIKDQKSYGVVSADGQQYLGGEVILSAGAFGSPAILMRSGIGPEEDLRALDIDVIKNLPVGKKLYEHPFYYNVYELKKAANAMSPAAGAILWTHTGSSPSDELDIHISATHFFDPALTQTGGAIVLAVSVVTPKSKGYVTLSSKDPLAAPVIRYNLLQDPSDLNRMVEGVKISRRIGKNQIFKDIATKEMFPGAAVTNDIELTKAIVEQIDIYQHPTSTVPMGTPEDPEAVTDQWGNVFGIENLRIVDASIMPYIVSAPPNLTTIMMAEHIFKNAYPNHLS